MARELIPIEVELNGEVKGDFILLSEPDGNYWVPEKDLTLWRLKLPADVPRLEENGEVYRLIQCDSETFQCKVDLAAARLKIVADARLFMPGSRTIGLRKQIKPIESSSGFLNYNLTYNGDGRTNNALSAPVEIGWRQGKWLALSNFNYTVTNSDEVFARMFTSLQSDNIARRTRFTIGDFSASTRSVLGGGGIFGGLSYGSDFSLDPFFVRLPGLEISGILDYPSEVEVFVDGQSVAREELPPGPFDLGNIVRSNGATDATIVIRDPFGNERRLDTSVYVPQRVLRHGVQEFHYAAGFRRENLGQANTDYGDWAALGYHRVGLSPWATLGVHAEGDSDTANMGVEGGILLGRWGELAFDVAGSRDGGEDGAAASASYQFIDGALSSSLVMRGYTRQYATLSSPAGGQGNQYQIQATVGYSFDSLGYLSLTHQLAQGYTNDGRSSTRVQYHKPLATGLTFSASYIYDRDDDYRLFFGLTFNGRKRGRLSLRHSQNGGQTINSVSLQRSAKPYQDFGFRLGAEHRTEPNSTDLLNAEVSYSGSVGDYRAGFQNTSGDQRYHARVAGALVLVGGGLHLSRPIRSGYALVEVGQPDVNIRLNNTVVAKSGTSGRAVVAGLSAYYKNTVSLDLHDLPIQYQVQKSREQITIRSRGGVIIDLPIVKSQPIHGKLAILDNGTREMAQYWRMQINKEESALDILIGKRGEFYIENLSSGIFSTKVSFKDKSCKFDLDIPDAPDIFVNLGEVTCQIK